MTITCHFNEEKNCTFIRKKVLFFDSLAKSRSMAHTDEGEVPPLEDMSDELESLKTRDTSVMLKSTQKKQISKSPKKKQAQGGFAGLKKGFLNASLSDPIAKEVPPMKKLAKQTTSTEKKSTTSGKDDIPHIKPKSKASGLELPEVQEAMKDTFPFLEKNDWLTEDLLSKVENHSNLSKVFQDPNLSQILVEFQKDPQKAMAAAQDNPEMRGFLQDFCALMGDHFTELADQEEKMTPAAGAGAAPLITEVKEPLAEDKVKEILAKPEIRKLLEDREVQKLLHLLKTNPDAAHSMSQTANQAMQEKIKLLIQNGLLAMHP